MKYLKTIIFMFSSIIIFNLITTILYYFNITSESVNNILKIIFFIITFILTGVITGKNASKKGWFEGLKISGITVPLFLILSLIFKHSFNLWQIVYYIIISLLIVLGSMIGINFKKAKK